MATNSKSEHRSEHPLPITDCVYLEEIAGTDVTKSADRFRSAHDTAMNIRQFEIDLYWKRATYFWALIAATLVSYGTVVSKSNEQSHFGTLEVLSALGWLFTTALWYVNRGSRFWQANWERHVDLLEDRLHGPIYKTIYVNKEESTEILGAKGYSVTRLSQMIVFPVWCVWLVLLANAAVHVSPHAHAYLRQELKIHQWVYDILSVSCALSAALGLLWFRRAGLNLWEKSAPPGYRGLIRRR